MKDPLLDISASLPAPDADDLANEPTPGTRALTPPAVAKRYGVNVHRVLNWIAKGELAAVNVGDGSRPRWRIMPEALAEFERRRAAQPRPAAKRRRGKKEASYTRYF